MKLHLKIGKNSYPVTVFDIVLAFTFIWLIVLASPYVAAQFKGMTAFGDIIWNLCLDFVALNGTIIVLIVLGSLLNLFEHWVSKKKAE